MLLFLHTYNPRPILISIGPLDIHWYGIFIVIGILAATVVVLKLAEYHHLSKNTVVDSSFWLIISGIIGARFYHVFLEWPYYLAHPLNSLKIWRGGLAIHGGIIAGIVVVWLYAKKIKTQPSRPAAFFLLSSIYATGLALAQAIGRWGNYFNQELFGRPTKLPWGIPIMPENRVAGYYNHQYFHPAFLYESIGNLIIFFVLMALQIWIIRRGAGRKSQVERYALCVASYLVMYSALRLGMEFIRIDYTPVLFGWRFPQLISLLIIAAALLFLYTDKKIKISPNLEKK